MPPSGVAAFGNTPQRNSDYRCRKREIDEEDPAPGGMLNEPAAEHRTDRGGDRRETRPPADRVAAAVLVEGRADDCKAAGHAPRSSHTLNGPPSAQPSNGRSEYPASRFCSTRNFDMHRPDYGLVARRSHGGYGCTLVWIRLERWLKDTDAESTLGTTLSHRSLTSR